MGVKKIIKLGLISIVVIFFLLTLISLLLPSTVIVSRSVDVNVAPDSVYNQINDLTKWHHWIANRDTLPVQITNAGKAATLQMGNTKVKIQSSQPSQIITRWQAGKGNILPGYFNLTQSSQTSHTTLQWQFVLQVKWYPWERFAAVVSDKAIGPFMEQSLDNLKQYLESSN